MGSISIQANQVFLCPHYIKTKDIVNFAAVSSRIRRIAVNGSILMGTMRVTLGSQVSLVYSTICGKQGEA